MTHHWDWSLPPGPMWEKITTVEPWPNSRPASRSPSADRKCTARLPAIRSRPDGRGDGVEVAVVGLTERLTVAPPVVPEDDAHATGAMTSESATATHRRRST